MIMVKKIRFPLDMNGTDVRTLEELREHFDLESVLGYFANGKLTAWLRNRYYDSEAEAIEKLTISDSELVSKICAVLGVDFTGEDLNVLQISRRYEKLVKLRQFTDDEEIISSVDNIAVDQNDLAGILSNDPDTVYLLGESFKIPLEHKNVCYIGINKPVLSIEGSDLGMYDENYISFKNVDFEDGTDYYTHCISNNVRIRI
jgi:hypothetical protein